MKFKKENDKVYLVEENLEQINKRWLDKKIEIIEKTILKLEVEKLAYEEALKQYFEVAKEEEIKEDVGTEPLLN